MSPVRVILLAILAAAGSAASEGPVTWDPFPSELPDVLRLESPWLGIAAGDHGASLLLLHEPGAGPLVEYLRDGLPRGTGHLRVDDPWTVALAGVEAGPVAAGVDGRMALPLVSAAPDSSGARLDTRFFKGGLESYLRRLSFRTPVAPWTARFDFDERILHDFLTDGYSTADIVSGGAFADQHARRAKARTARTAVSHLADDGSRTTIAYARSRKHKHLMPADGLERQEVWGEQLHVTWRGRAVGSLLTAGDAVNGTDLLAETDATTLTGDVDPERTVSVQRREARLDWRSPGAAWGAVVRGGAWRAAELDAYGVLPGVVLAPSRLGRQEADARLVRNWQAGTHVLSAAAGAGWHRGLGVRPAASVDLSNPDGGWRAALAWEYRTPRSDELVSPWTAVADGFVYRLLPEPDLERESVVRGALGWSGRFAGFDVGVDATARRLRDGIGWRAESFVGHDLASTPTGRWANGVSLDAWTASWSLARRFRFGGDLWTRARLDLRGWTAADDPAAPLPVFLPPERSAVLDARWTRSAFSGDGIFELGWQVEHRGESANPWVPGTGHRLEAVTLHHALLMFRLTGADIGVAFRNVLDADVPLAGGDAVRGREMRWRLQWTLMR